MDKIKLTKEYESGKENTQIFSSIDENEFSMSIDPKSMSHIVARLTDLYANPIVATVREIMSNAIDSTMLIPLADRKPIEVELPSTFSLFFGVTDHGVGLSLEEIKKIYTRYGSSTKRGDYSQIGAYGLGSKAPLSYTNEFTVSSVKNHELSEILITSSGEANTVKIVNHGTSDSDNYMKVMIPVANNDIDKFLDAARTYYNHEVKGITFSGLDILSTSSNTKFIDISKMNFKGYMLDLSYCLNDNNYRDIFYRLAVNDITNIRIVATLMGFEYELSDTSDYDGILSVNLIPGIVNFASSRDNITNDTRSEDLANAVMNYLKTDNFKAALIFKVLKDNLSDKDKLYTYYHLLCRGELDSSLDELKSSNIKHLFVLSNGYNLLDLDINVLGFIDSNKNTANDDTRKKITLYDYPSGKISNLTKAMTKYFNPDVYRQELQAKIDKINVEEPSGSDYTKNMINKYTGLKNQTDDKIKALETVFLGNLYEPDNTDKIFVTGIDDLTKAKKVMNQRNKVLKSSYPWSNFYFVCAEQPKSFFEKVLPQDLIDLLQIKLYSYDEFEDLYKKKKQIDKKDTKKEHEHLPFDELVHSTYLVNPNIMLGLLSNSHISNFKTYKTKYDESSLDVYKLLLVTNSQSTSLDIYEMLTLIKLSAGKKIQIDEVSASNLILDYADSLSDYDNIIPLVPYRNIRAKHLQKLVKDKDIDSTRSMTFDFNKYDFNLTLNFYLFKKFYEVLGEEVDSYFVNSQVQSLINVLNYQYDNNLERDSYLLSYSQAESIDLSFDNVPNNVSVMLNVFVKILKDYKAANNDSFYDFNYKFDFTGYLLKVFLSKEESMEWLREI